MTSPHRLSSNTKVLPPPDEDNAFDLADEKLKSGSGLNDVSKTVGPRWQKKRTQGKRLMTEPNKMSDNNNSSSSRREEFMRSIKQAVDLSFYMTASSISSLGDGSITSIYDYDESGPSVDGSKKKDLDERIQHELPEEDFEKMPPLASFRSTRSTDRWDIASHDSLPASPPFRRSFEIPRSSTQRENQQLVTLRASYSGDTLPQMPRRKEISDD